jgi:hypothetical protein
MTFSLLLSRIRVSENKIRRVAKIHEGPRPSTKVLDERCAVVIDLVGEIYVWIGKKSGMERKKECVYVCAYFSP